MLMGLPTDPRGQGPRCMEERKLRTWEEGASPLVQPQCPAVPLYLGLHTKAWYPRGPQCHGPDPQATKWWLTTSLGWPTILSKNVD